MAKLIRLFAGGGFPFMTQCGLVLAATVGIFALFQWNQSQNINMSEPKTFLDERGWESASTDDALRQALYRSKLEIDLGHLSHAQSCIQQTFEVASKKKFSAENLSKLAAAFANAFGRARYHSPTLGLINSLSYTESHGVPDSQYQQCEKFYKDLSQKFGHGKVETIYSPDCKSSEVEPEIKLVEIPFLATPVAVQALIDQGRVAAAKQDFDSTVSFAESAVNIARKERAKPGHAPTGARFSDADLVQAYLAAVDLFKGIQTAPDNDLRWRRIGKFYAERAWELAPQVAEDTLRKHLAEEVSAARRGLSITGLGGENGAEIDTGRLMWSIPQASSQTRGVTPESLESYLPVSACLENSESLSCSSDSRSELLSLIEFMDQLRLKRKWKDFDSTAAQVFLGFHSSSLNVDELQDAYINTGRVFFDQYTANRDSFDEANHCNLQAGILAQICYERAEAGSSNDAARCEALKKLLKLQENDEEKVKSYNEKLEALLAKTGHSDLERFEALMSHGDAIYGSDIHGAAQNYKKALEIATRKSIQINGVQCFQMIHVFENDKDFQAALPLYEYEVKDERSRLGAEHRFDKNFVQKYANCLSMVGRSYEVPKLRAELEVKK